MFLAHVDGFDMIAICVEKINLFRHVVAGGIKNAGRIRRFCLQQQA